MRSGSGICDRASNSALQQPECSRCSLSAADRDRWRHLAGRRSDHQPEKKISPMAQQSEHQRTAKTLPPMRIGEVVLKTARFDAMNRWWQTVLGVSPHLESERFAFRRLPSDYPYTEQLMAIATLT